MHIIRDTGSVHVITGFTKLNSLDVDCMTMVVGQGAGVIAAISAKDRSDIQKADYLSVCTELERQDVLLS